MPPDSCVLCVVFTHCVMCVVCIVSLGSVCIVCVVSLCDVCVAPCGLLALCCGPLWEKCGPSGRSFDRTPPPISAVERGVVGWPVTLLVTSLWEESERNKTVAPDLIHL